MIQHRVLVITLYSGEAEYESCKKSVKEQDYGGLVDHIFIENLPNRAAHRKCYETIMKKTEDYELFVKLDADMVFTRKSAISDMIRFWRNEDKPDHMVCAVKDFIPNRLSMGVHVFTKNCKWTLDESDPLFVDPNPTYPGHKVKCWDDPAPFVIHAPKPTRQQAFHFGFHRALKAFQYNRVLARPQAFEAFRILMATARHYKKTGNPLIEQALMGAESVRRRAVDLQTGDKGRIVMIDYEVDFWQRPKRAWLYWWMMTGWRMIPLWLYSKVKQVLDK